MTFIGVPWAVGGGAKNTVETARLAAFVATRGAAGVVLPSDLDVRESDVPDGFVNVHPGSVVIPNGAAGTSAETYLGKNVGLHPLPITATGAGETRSDLIYVNVADPQYAGQPAPADLEDGPYIEPKVCAGVLPSTTSVADAIDQGLLPAGTTGVALARVDLPAATGTVTQALIADLRQLANPRALTQAFDSNPGAEDDWYLDESSYRVFPAQAAFTVRVPEWATDAIIRADAVGVNYYNLRTEGDFRVSLGTVKGKACYYEAGGDTGGRDTFSAGDTLAIPADMRGTTQTVSLEARRTGGEAGTNSRIAAGPNINTFLRVEFVERIESSA